MMQRNTQKPLSERIAEIEKGLQRLSTRGNQTAAHYLEQLSACENDEEKQVVIETMRDDALRFHGFMIDLAQWLERKYLPNERSTWRLQ